MLLLTITLHDTTKCCDLSLWQCFTGIYVYAYLTVQSSLVSEGRLKPTFHFRYCGTIKDLTFKRSLCSQNGLLSLVDRFVGLGVFCLLSAKRFLMLLIIVPAPKCWPDFFCTFKMHISFCQRTSAFYSWSSILFILPDLYPFRYLVITLPCLKKKRKKKSLLKEKK